MTLFEKDWGFMAGSISMYKFEFLPRLTMTAIADMLEINLGFLWFQVWLTIWSKRMQDFNRRHHGTE
jgi:hypothetical protein